MDFTYRTYGNLVKCLKEQDHFFCRYDNVYDKDKTVIMRHDIDLSLDKAVKMAEFENRLGISSTYFVLLSTNFYNIATRDSYNKIRQIIAIGHDVGLHFDEERYAVDTEKGIQEHIMKEVDILSSMLNHKVTLISMHRPSKLALNGYLELPGIINSYASNFFTEMKYLSDSRMHWREDVFEIVRSNEFDRLHILTHPFWYSPEKESMELKLRAFLNKAIIEKYDNLNCNFRNLDEVIAREGLDVS